MNGDCRGTAVTEDLWLTTGLVIFWIALAVGILAWNYQTSIYLSIVKAGRRKRLCRVAGVHETGHYADLRQLGNTSFLE